MHKLHFTSISSFNLYNHHIRQIILSCRKDWVMKLYNWPTRTRLLLNGGVRDKKGVGSFWELLTHILLPTCCVVWMPWVCACGRWGEVRDVCSVGSPTHFPVLLWPNSRHSPLESSRGVGVICGGTISRNYCLALGRGHLGQRRLLWLDTVHPGGESPMGGCTQWL